MKKLLIVALVLGLAFVAGNVNAQEKYVGGGFEASGHIVAGMGYQHFNNKTQTEVANNGDVTTYAGPMGKYLGNAPTNRQDAFSFFVDEVELDLVKSFGENVRFRADLDFGRANSSGRGTNAFSLEQAYATANIPIGNGVEFLLGRFNTPIGFESADVADNDLISQTILVRGMRPVNTTGAKIYYAFNDLVDLHFYVVNSLYRDSMVKWNDVPSMGARLGFNWGEEGTESTVGISAFFGPESRVSNKHFTYGVDVDANWWATESFALGLEALFVRSDSVTNTKSVTAGSNLEALGGLVNLHYLFSDVWDGTLRYSLARQYDRATGTDVTGTTPLFNSNFTGAEQWVHEIALGGGYAIADGAKFKLEGRMDIVNPEGASNTEYVYGAVAGFVYDF